MTNEEQLATMITSLGFELYDAEILKENEMRIYRVSITSPNGITLDQCVQVSDLISPYLDVHPPMDGEYRLEVSSPGIERKLKMLRHFVLSIGDKVVVSLKNGDNYKGTLSNIEGETITIDVPKEGIVTFNFNEVSKAKTYFEF